MMFRIAQPQNNSGLVQRLLNNSDNRRTSLQLGFNSSQKILSQINQGSIEINKSYQDFHDYIDHKVKALSLQIINQSEQYKNYQRDYKIMKGIPLQKEINIFPKQQDLKKIQREVQLNQIKYQQRQAKKQFKYKMKIWQQQKDRIQRKKMQIQERKKNQQNKIKESQQKQQAMVDEFLRLQKQKMIEQRIKQIQQRQKQRLQKPQSHQRTQSMPKFMQAQQKQRQNLKMKQAQVKILLKNRKSQLQMKMEEIKQHQKAYIDRIKQRLNMKSHKKLSKSMENDKDSQNNKEDFSLFKKDLQQQKKLQQKIKKLKKFQSKLRLMPLNIDSEKRKQMQIRADKLKNSKKYIFLSQKALSDEKIYENFKEFDININNRELGNQYFEQVKELNKYAKKKTASQKVLPTKIIYKDYLKQKRQSQPNVSNRPAKKRKPVQESIQSGRSFLIKKSEQYENKAISKIQELNFVTNYGQSIEMQKQIDKNFMKAIYSKLAIAKMS